MTKLIVLLALTIIELPAADRRRLESVTWDPVSHVLRWVVSSGAMHGENYKPVSHQEYEIRIDEATMRFSDETRHFSKREAESVRQVLNMLASYATESTIWWEQGQGESTTKRERVSRPQWHSPDCAGLNCRLAASSGSSRPKKQEGL